MYFVTVRIIIFAVLFALLIFGIIKSGFFKKRYVKIVSLIMLIVLAIVSVVFPFENLFVDFKTPQEAYNYYRNSPPIHKVVDGEDSCCIISQSGADSTIQLCMFLKKDGVYKLPTPFSSKTVSKHVGGVGIFELINILGTNDYYLNATYVKNANKGGLSDNMGTEFVETELSDSSVFSVAYLHNISGTYEFSVNNEKTTMIVR